MLRRFGPTAHLVNAISFAVAQVLIAGVNLYLLATIIDSLLGWPPWVSPSSPPPSCCPTSRSVAFSAAIYNEVLQFFVIVAALLPLTMLGLHKVGGWDGLTDKMADRAPTELISCSPGQAPT